MYHTKYSTSFEAISKMKSDAEIRELLYTLATQKRVIVYTHPNNARYNDYWDLVNYYKKNIYEFGKWLSHRKKARRRPSCFTSE